MKQGHGRFSGSAPLVLGGVSLSKGPVVILGGRPGNRGFFQDISYLRCDLLDDLRGAIKTVSQQEVEVGQQPCEDGVDLNRSLKSAQRGDGVTESLVPVGGVTW